MLNLISMATPPPTMKSTLKSLTGETVAEVETTADDGALMYEGKLYCPVQFMKADGKVDWDRIGSEYVETVARVIK